MRRFEVTEGSEGVGLTGYGRTLEELCAHLALGMFGLRADVTMVQPMATVPVIAQADDLDRLVVAWLQELLVAAHRDGLVFMNCRVHQVAPTAMNWEAVGQALDPERHTLYRELATVTGGAGVVRRDGDLWVAHVVFPLGGTKEPRRAGS